MTLDRPFSFLWPGVPAEGETLSQHGNAKDPDYRIDAETGCWLWLKFKLRGYGRTSYKGTSRWAHRVYYELAFGPLPAGSDVHHRCKNPACVNPAHLELLPSRSAHLAMHKQEASSLTWDDVRAIRDAVKAGVRQQELRLRYGIAQPTLSDIITGTTWRDPDYKRGVSWSAVCASVARSSRRRGLTSGSVAAAIVDAQLACPWWVRGPSA